MTVTTTYQFVQGPELEFSNVKGNADAAGLEDGGIAVVGLNVATNRTTIFDTGGVKLGQSAGVNGTGPAVSELDDGNIVVVGDVGSDIGFTILDGKGATVVALTKVGDDNAVSNADVAGLTGGAFAVAYQRDFGSESDIAIAIRDNNGNNVDSFVIDGSSEDDEAPSIAALEDGGFAVAWHRNVNGASELWYAVYEADGTERTPPTLFDNFGATNRNASVVGTADGGFAIAYEDDEVTGQNTDIRLALFDANGFPITSSFTTTSSANDESPSLAVLSNGMFVVASTDDAAAGNTEIRYTLFDQFANQLASSATVNSTPFDDIDPTVAGTLLGQFASVFTNDSSDELVGRILQATRITKGDAAKNDLQINLINPDDDLRDVISGEGGDDTIRGGFNGDIMSGGAGKDTFIVSGKETGGPSDEVLKGKFIGPESIDGGTDLDRILVKDDISSQTSLVGVILASIEEIEFDQGNTEATAVTIAASDIGKGLAANLIIDGNSTGVEDKLRVEMGAATNVNLSAFTFVQFATTGPDADRIVVLGDNDAETIVGTTIRDELYGSGGDDKLTGGRGGDYISGGTGTDTASYATASAGLKVSLTTPGTNTGDAAGDTYNSIENVTGSAKDDTIEGNTAKNYLDGGSGNDQMSGLSGADVLFGGEGNDVLSGGTGADRISGGVGSDRASYAGASAAVTMSLTDPSVNTGEAAGDTYNSIENLLGSAHNDSLEANAISNHVDGGAGNDNLNGLAGNDTLFGGEGSDTLRGGLGADYLSGGTGGDTASYKLATAAVTVSLSNPSINKGEAAGDTFNSVENVFGSNFNDTLTGNSANNAITGGLGNDIIRGQGGNDTLGGSSGKDIFIFDTALNAVGNVDKIVDFSSADDTIQLENAIFTALTTTGTLAATAFKDIDAGAIDANDRILYDRSEGLLYYDSNGSASGGRFLFAHIQNEVALTNADFVII